MTSKNILYALDGLEPRLVLDADPAAASKPKSKRMLKWGTLVACLALCLCSVPIMMARFNGGHSKYPAPPTLNYTGIAEAENALQYPTLFGKLDPEVVNITNIRISYRPDNTGKPIMSEPLQMIFRLSEKNTTDRVACYLLFECDNVDDSYVGGYDEQNIRFSIGGITVHYCQHGRYGRENEIYEQAKFVYDGKVYILDAVSYVGKPVLEDYLNMLLQ